MTNALRTFNVGTATVRVHVEKDATDGRFALIEWGFPPGAPAPPQHVHHDASETFFVIEGELTVPSGDDLITLTAGHSLHVTPGMPHTLSNRSDKTARALELFSPGDLIGLVEEMGRVFAAAAAAGQPPDPATVATALAAFNSEAAA